MTAAAHGAAYVPPPSARPAADSWRFRPAAQQPDWPDPGAVRAVTAELAARAPLVAADRCDRLRARLAAVAGGEAFLLQGGDCAETFDAATPGKAVRTLDTLARMAAVLRHGARTPVVTVGRIAGQYAKPRSLPTETRDGVTLPSYRGDAVNDRAFTAAARTPDPARLTRAYRASAATLEALRTALDGRPRAEFFTSHEALLLAYESALTRVDRRTGARYGTSGHMLWVGQRTRRLDGAHVAFLRGLRNPIGVKLGPDATADDALALVDRLDPRREPGRLTFVTRMGAAAVRDVLPGLVEKVAADGARVVWACDPMHGNTVTAPDGHKTRHFDAILDEISGFLQVHRGLGTHPGGLHLELTGEPVTECLGGTVARVGPDDLGRRYESACDPRLNHGQSVELAHHVARLLADG